MAGGDPGEAGALGGSAIAGEGGGGLDGSAGLGGGLGDPAGLGARAGERGEGWGEMEGQHA